MTRRFTLRFDTDMPAAAVEVVADDASTLGRVWISPGESAEIDVPEVKAHLTLYLPSGRLVTMPIGKETERSIGLADIQERQTPASARLMADSGSIRAIRKYASQQYASTALSIVSSAATAAANKVRLGNVADASLATRKSSVPVAGILAADGNEVAFDCSGTDVPMEFIADTPGGALHVQIPGSAVSVWARVDRVSSTEAGPLHVAVRVATSDPVADALTQYLCRGDLRSAESITSGAASAESLLSGKAANPYAAAVGAYLLLRLRRFEEMRDWAQGLADKFDELSDGSVIWARQLILQFGSQREAEIKTYLGRAVDRGLPVFREGLVLLSESLAMLGSDGDAWSRTVSQQLGRSVLDSPLTAGIIGSSNSSAQRVEFDVGIAPRG